MFTEPSSTRSQDVSSENHSFQEASFFQNKSPHDSEIFRLAGVELDLKTLAERAAMLGEILENLQKRSVAAEFSKLDGINISEYVQTLCCIPANISPQNTMWLRRLAVSIADTYGELSKEFEVIKNDPACYMSKLLGVDILNIPEITLSPTSIFVTMEAFDYGRAADNLKLATQGYSYGTILFLDKLPEGVRSKIILINMGDGQFVTHRSEYHLWITKRHEELHGHFDLVRRLSNRDAYVSFRDEFNKIVDPHCYQAHERLANKVNRYIYDVARSELISYYSSYFEEDVWDSSVFFLNHDYLKGALENFISQSEITEKEVDEIRDIYKRVAADFQANYIEYKKVVRALYFGSESVRHRNEIDAALMLIPIEDLDVLKQYLSSTRLVQNSELPISRIG